MGVFRLRAFGQCWISWIATWLETSKVHVLVNGVLGSRETPIATAVHLGDPQT